MRFHACPVRDIETKSEREREMTGKTLPMWDQFEGINVKWVFFIEFRVLCPPSHKPREKKTNFHRAFYDHFSLPSVDSSDRCAQFIKRNLFFCESAISLSRTFFFPKKNTGPPHSLADRTTQQHSCFDTLCAWCQTVPRNSIKESQHHHIKPKVTTSLAERLRQRCHSSATLPIQPRKWLLSFARLQYFLLI